MAILDISKINKKCMTLLMFGVQLSSMQKDVIKLWPGMDFHTKREFQKIYSKYLKNQKYGATQDSLSKTAKDLFNANI